MNELEDVLQGRSDTARVVAKDPKRLGGPQGLVGGRVPGEAPRQAQPLGLGQERLTPPQRLFGLLEVLDVVVGADPLDDISVLVADGHAAEEVPAIDAVGPSQARLTRTGGAGGHARLPDADDMVEIVGMNGVLPPAVDRLLVREAGELQVTARPAPRRRIAAGTTSRPSPVSRLLRERSRPRPRKSAHRTGAARRPTGESPARCRRARPRCSTSASRARAR